MNCNFQYLNFHFKELTFNLIFNFKELIFQFKEFIYKNISNDQLLIFAGYGLIVNICHCFKLLGNLTANDFMPKSTSFDDRYEDQSDEDQCEDYQSEDQSKKKRQRQN